MNLEHTADANPAIDRNFQKLASLVPDMNGQSVAVRWGAVTLTYTAAAVSAAASVTHGLGGVPEFIGSMGTTSAANRHVVNYVAGSRNGTTFQLQAETVDSAAVSLSISVFWIAIG